MRFIKHLMIVLILLAGSSSLCAADVVLLVDKNPPTQIQFAVSEVTRSFEGLGETVRTTTDISTIQKADRVLAVTTGDSGLSRGFFAEETRAVPKPAESFAILKNAGNGRVDVLVLGRDATGAMYGALDVAETNEMAAKPFPEGISEKQERPYLELRGMNPFIHTQALEDPNSWYYSDEFWREYINMLARNRINFLDFHACFDMDSTGFPNVFPYFIYLEEYPNVGVGKKRAERNLAIFKRVTELAKARGIKVGLMNYYARAPVPGDKLADYTAKCVEKLLHTCPDLWCFGFRIGESGQREDFFRRSYIAGVNAADRPINLYTRTWIASREKIMEIAKAHKRGRFLVEIKYNGEHLGAPYQVQGKRMSGYGSYSFQTYTNYPRDYDIVWQIRANGTHRIFQWGDPEFARRVARSCRLGEAAGFTLEPITAYYPLTDYFLNRKTFGKPFFKWTFQRNWFWYMVWGRTAYDPDVSDAVFVHAFQKLYGKKEGRRLYGVTVAASHLVPMIYCYHCLGPDHRNMAPEFETGNGHAARRLRDGKAWIQHYDITRFLGVYPLDDTVMVRPRDAVDELLAGEMSGKLGPREVVAWLRFYADEARKVNESDSKHIPASERARFLDLKLDALALADLADYYAAKIQAAYDLQAYRVTGDFSRLLAGRKKVAEANACWEKLATVTERHFRPIPERLRMCTMFFTWRKEGKDLPKDLDRVDRMIKDYEAQASRPNPILGHLPQRIVAPGVKLHIAVSKIGGKADVPKLYWAKNDGPFATVDMQPTSQAHLFETMVDPDGAKTVRYYFSAKGKDGTVYLPTEGPAKPFVVRVTSDTAGPEIAVKPVPRDTRGDHVVITARITDENGVAKAFVRYKKLPSFYLWVDVPMRRHGDRYAARIPLTPEGIMYEVLAVDNLGNATLWPNVLKETPYRWIRPWAPKWVDHGFIDLPEGTAIYHPKVGERPFEDRDDVIEQFPKELSGKLIGIRVPSDVIIKAQQQGGGGYPFRYRVKKPARLFVVYVTGRASLKTWKLYARDKYKQGGKAYPILARDLQPGDGEIVFRKGIGVILGFKELTPVDPPLKEPGVPIAGMRCYGLRTQDFVSIPLEFEFYPAKVGERVYTDRLYAIRKLPKEVEGAIGVRFSNDAAKQRNLKIPFRLTKPARMFVIFGNPYEGAWDKPHKDWNVFAKDAYQHGPGDELIRTVYYKDFQPGDHVFTFVRGTGVILGFKPLSDFKK